MSFVFRMLLEDIKPKRKPTVVDVLLSRSPNTSIPVSGEFFLLRFFSHRLPISQSLLTMWLKIEKKIIIIRNHDPQDFRSSRFMMIFTTFDSHNLWRFSAFSNLRIFWWLSQFSIWTNCACPEFRLSRSYYDFHVLIQTISLRFQPLLILTVSDDSRDFRF